MACRWIGGFFLASALFWTAVVRPVLSSAQTLEVTGAPDQKLSLTASDFAKFPRTMISATEHGKEHKYEGVLLRDVLKQAGAPMGDRMKGSNMAAFVYLTAKDGYHATLALAEVEPAFQDNHILIADSMDGKPLSAEQGPFRLVVPEDKKPARWIRMLESIEVRVPEVPVK